MHQKVIEFKKRRSSVSPTAAMDRPVESDHTTRLLEIEEQKLQLKRQHIEILEDIRDIKRSKVAFIEQNAANFDILYKRMQKIEQLYQHHQGFI